MNSMNGYMGAGSTNTGRMKNPFTGGGRGGAKGDVIPKGQRAGSIQVFTPEQIEHLQNLYSYVSPDSYLARLAGGDESIFNEIEAPEYRRFSGLLGNIASRFSGAGGQKSLGSRNTGAFQRYTSQAASDFAQDLASRRQQLQRQAVLDLMGISESLLSQRPYERILAEQKQKEPGFWKTFGMNFAKSGGESLGQNFNIRNWKGSGASGENAVPVPGAGG